MSVTRTTGIGLVFLHALGFFLKTIHLIALERMVYKIGIKYSERNGAAYSAEGFCHCLTSTYLERGDNIKALDILKDRIKANPKCLGYAYLGLANLYAEINERELAVQNYRKALDSETSEQWKAEIQADWDQFLNGTLRPGCALRRNKREGKIESESQD